MLKIHVILVYQKPQNVYGSTKIFKQSKHTHILMFVHVLYKHWNKREAGDSFISSPQRQQEGVFFDVDFISTLFFTGVINSRGYAVSSTQRFQDNQLIGHIEKSVSSSLSLEKALCSSLSLWLQQFHRTKKWRFRFLSVTRKEKH